MRERRNMDHVSKVRVDGLVTDDAVCVPAVLFALCFAAQRVRRGRIKHERFVLHRRADFNQHLVKLGARQLAKATLEPAQDALGGRKGAPNAGCVQLHRPEQAIVDTAKVADRKRDEVARNRHVLSPNARHRPV
jgi:hypothetical protein